MKKSTKIVSAIPRTALTIIGQMLAVARKERSWQQAELAKRLSVSRQTVARMEKGDPTVAVGTVFSAAWILDVPIFPGMQMQRNEANDALSQLITILKEMSPKPTKQSEREIDDNF